MTSPDDQLDGIFSQIAAQDQVDPSVFDRTLEAAFDYTGSGLDDLLPEIETTLPDDTDDTTDDAFVGDTTDDFGSDDTDTDPTDFTDHTTDYPDPIDTSGDDLLT